MQYPAADQRASEVRSAVIAGWVLLAVTCGISLIPFLGFVAWVLGSVTIVIAIILGIVAISKGGTWHGVFILLASLIGVPVFILIAPFVTTMLTGAALESGKEQVEGEVSVEVLDDSGGVEAGDSESQAATGSDLEAPENATNVGDSDGSSEKTESAPASPTAPAPATSGGPEQ